MWPGFDGSQHPCSVWTERVEAACPYKWEQRPMAWGRQARQGETQVQGQQWGSREEEGSLAPLTPLTPPTASGHRPGPLGLLANTPMHPALANGVVQVSPNVASVILCQHLSSPWGPLGVPCFPFPLARAQRLLPITSADLPAEVSPQDFSPRTSQHTLPLCCIIHRPLSWTRSISACPAFP